MTDIDTDFSPAAAPLAEKLLEPARAIIARYPAGRERSALLPLLHLVQTEEGFVSPNGVAQANHASRCEPSAIMRSIRPTPRAATVSPVAPDRFGMTCAASRAAVAKVKATPVMPAAWIAAPVG